VEENEKVTIPLIGMKVSETGSYLVYGGIGLFLLLCCCIAVTACICMSKNSTDRRKSIMLEKELEKLKNEKKDQESKRDGSAMETNAQLMSQEETLQVSGHKPFVS
jgi:hypothetical protein